MSHYENVQSAAPEDFKLTRWQDVIDFVLYHPEYVSILLVAAGAFDLIDFWINNFSVPRDLSKVSGSSVVLFESNFYFVSTRYQGLDYNVISVSDAKTLLY